LEERRPFNVLQVENIHTYYGESHILRGISLELAKGSLVALVGRNGMGKTTTVHSINGFVPPRSGAVHFMGEDITGRPPHVIARKGIGLVPQERRIFPSLSVKENLTMAARNAGADNAWDLDKVFSSFPLLRDRANYKGNRLSGGEQQVLCIARALMTNPILLLMDEPSEGLAPIIVREIGRIIRQLKEEGLSTLLIEQNLPLALGLADYVYVISKGEIVYQSTPQKLRENKRVMSEHLGVQLAAL
jgi:branched-chain amino acid transport system ATP-binding protein